jgi:hypothetical protein
MVGGCSNRGHNQTSDSLLELSDLFIPLPGVSEAVLGSGSLSRNFPVTRKGIRRNSLILRAPAGMQLPLRGLSGRARFRAYTACVFNVGDGVRMDIVLTGGGFERKLLSRVYDAARRAEDRDWIPIDVEIDIAENTSHFLQVSVSAGPQGDLTGDWLALASPELVFESRELKRH